MNPSDINGAEVTCYIPALDEGTARELLMESLREHRFRLMGEKWFVDDVEMEWGKPLDEDVAEYINRALDTGNVVFSEFHTWGHDAPNAYPADEN